MSLPRVLILHNQPVLASDHPNVESEAGMLGTVAIVESVLRDAGFTVGKLGVSHDPGTLIKGVHRFRADVVFNLFEGTGDAGQTEAFAAGLLEWLKVPFTGCTAPTLNLARNKPITKHVLRSAGLPTSDFLVIDDAVIPEITLNWPLIVKPALQDASVGLDQGSVVSTREQLESRVAHILKCYGSPVLVEEFIHGREFNVAVVELPELTVLPAAEIRFIDETPGYWPIVTYEAKWRSESPEYLATPVDASAKVPARLARSLARIARDAFRLTGCRDYARVDFRVRDSSKPFILEVNPNPDFSPEAGLSEALKGANVSHSEFTVQLLYNALARVSHEHKFDRCELIPLQSAN